MKQLNLIAGKAQFIENDEAQNIKQQLTSGAKFIELRNGSLINVSVIASITKVDDKEMYLGYPVNTDKSGAKSIVKNNQRIYIDKRGINKIKKIPITESIKKLSTVKA